MRYLFLFLISAAATANCDGLKEAIETCRIYECEIPTQIKSIKISFKVFGLKDNICTLETTPPNPTGKGDLSQVCQYKKSSLPIAAEVNWLPIEYQNNLVALFEKLKSAGDNAMSLSEDAQKKGEAFSERMNQLMPKILAEHNGKSPCSPKDANATGEFNQKMQEFSQVLKPLAASFQKLTKAKLEKLLPERKSGCILSNDLQNLDEAKKIPKTATLNDCKTLENRNCSDLLNLTDIKNLSCPFELHLLWATPTQEMTGDKISVSSDIISSKVCEVNGLMRQGKKITFDPELKKKIFRYCSRPAGYECRVRLYSADTSIELDSSSELIRERDGAEVKCLKVAKRLARPHCESAKKNILSEVIVSVKDRKDPLGTMFSHTFKNFCPPTSTDFR